jgi:hypothetical protein
MKIILLLSIVFMIHFNSLLAQDSAPYKEFKKELVFEDTFTDNRNNWRTFYSKVKKGRYNVETLGKDPDAIVSIPVDLDPTRNYEIKITASMEWNRSKEFMGITWNRDLNNGYFLGINKEMKTTLIEKTDNKDEVLEAPQTCAAVRGLYIPNEILIRKVDNMFSIYINRLKVYSIVDDASYKNHIGFYVGKASELKVTQFKVSYLN